MTLKEYYEKLKAKYDETDWYDKQSIKRYIVYQRRLRKQYELEK